MKKYLYKILHLSILSIVICTVSSAVLLLLVFTTDIIPEFISYFIYTSAYSLCVFLIYLIPKFNITIKKLLSRIPLMNRYFNDKLFKAQISILISLFNNSVFSILYALMAFTHKSYVQMALAFYNLVFTVMRFKLATSVEKAKMQESDRKTVSEWKSYRSCGILMFLMSLTMTGIIEQLIAEGKSAAGEILTIALAAYTFYCFIISIINIVKYTRLNSPIIIASKNVCFARALMMLFSLQISMFSQYGNLDGYTEKAMNIAMGTVICVSCIFIAVFMIIKANKSIKNIEERL